MKLTKGQIFSVLYHDQYKYPLTREELDRWQIKSLPTKKIDNRKNIKTKDGYYFLSGHEEIINLRKKRGEHSRYKLRIAREAAILIGKIPSVLFVGITGGLAMKNADKEDDIDLMIITKTNTLWITRLLVYGLLRLNNVRVRKPKEREEEDKLCLNLWLDETAIYWEPQNEFTAHEIAQVIPLVNKSQTFEKFLWINKWILNYWPNAIEIKKTKPSSMVYPKQNWLNWFAFKLEYLYMKRKITNEVAELHKALFHRNG